ncbi:uncharacterized protein K452DRAFT_300549 [Aplosporella prunicola CBS 121167]|uniref:Uncharacterized protein n=1 Tax=Aplosporella prunicola CBS 121167 TaxID=1176127 RepID=A0A6A6B4A8_9PEZI|nr:uncharacterized protein K452DRAFT_300549 [Aplosporella prunicola CBS 121167]KAF2138962.1 hypothetical protein K452DRAFT_300549 [Aplosporella prunicola CBS 121167]
MLLAAQKLLDGVVAAAGRGELCLAFQDAWTMLTSPGLPAACAVAAELVRLHKHEYTHTSCSRLPSSSPANADGSNAGHSPLNRSHAIQSLAVYLAALARIPPLDPAARICKRGKAFLAKALEHVLGGSGPGPLPHRPPTEGSAAAASGEEAGVEGSADTNAAARTASIEVEGAREAVPARDELPLWTADLDAFGFGDDYDVLGLGELGWVGGSGSGWGFGEDGGMVW